MRTNGKIEVKIAILTTDNRSAFQRYELEKPWFGAAPEALLTGLAEFPEELEVHVISCTRHPVNAPEKIGENIWFHSLHVPKIGWMRTGYIGCISAVRRCLRRIQPDLVHGQGTELESGICAAFSGFPNVITLLGIMREMARLFQSRPGSFHWCAAAIEGIALKRTRGVLCNSRYTQEKLAGRTQKRWLVPNAVRLPYLATPLPKSSPLSEVTLLNVGTICSYKRQLELLDLLDPLAAEGFKFRLRFIGEIGGMGSYANDFRMRLQRSAYASHQDYIPLSELIKIYDSSTSLIHVSAIETFGLVVAEALSRNLKFFGFGTGGVKDIAENVAAATTVPDGDWTGLRDAIRKWLAQGAPRPSGAAEIIRERYHPLEIARQHLKIYREVPCRTTALESPF